MGSVNNCLGSHIRFCYCIYSFCYPIYKTDLRTLCTWKLDLLTCRIIVADVYQKTRVQKSKENSATRHFRGLLEKPKSSLKPISHKNSIKQHTCLPKRCYLGTPLHMNFSTTGHGTRWDFLEIANYQRYQKVHVISSKHLQKLCKF